MANNEAGAERLPVSRKKKQNKKKKKKKKKTQIYTLYNKEITNTKPVVSFWTEVITILSGTDKPTKKQSTKYPVKREYTSQLETKKSYLSHRMIRGLNFNC